MQLNNNETHEVILINEITNGGIIYTIYESDYSKPINHTSYTGDRKYINWKLDKTLYPEVYYTFEENEIILAYEFLSTLEEYSNYTLTEYDQNWKFIDNEIRIIVDKKKLTVDIINNTPVGQLLTYVLSDPNIKDHTIDTKECNSIYIYLKFLLPEHQYILENTDTVIIDLIQ